MRLILAVLAFVGATLAATPATVRDLLSMIWVCSDLI